MLPPLRYMTLLGPPYFGYPFERREFVFELDFLGLVNFCPSAVTLQCWRVELFPLVYIIGVYLLHRLTRVLFSFLFLCYELYIIFIIFLAGRNSK